MGGGADDLVANMGGMKRSFSGGGWKLVIGLGVAVRETSPSEMGLGGSGGASYGDDIWGWVKMPFDRASEGNSFI